MKYMIAVITALLMSVSSAQAIPLLSSTDSFSFTATGQFNPVNFGSAVPNSYEFDSLLLITQWTTGFDPVFGGSDTVIDAYASMDQWNYAIGAPLSIADFFSTSEGSLGVLDNFDITVSGDILGSALFFANVISVLDGDILIDSSLYEIELGAFATPGDAFYGTVRVQDYLGEIIPVSIQTQVAVASVPTPKTASLFLLGLCGLMLVKRQQKTS